MLAMRLAAVLALSLVYSSSGITSHAFDIVDPVTDLQWKRLPTTTTVASRIVSTNEEDVTRSQHDYGQQDERPSATTLEAILMNPTVENQPPFRSQNLDRLQQRQLQLAASQLLSLMNLPEGKRRLDDDTGVMASLASNQQWQTNRYRQPLAGAGANDHRSDNNSKRRMQLMKKNSMTQRSGSSSSSNGRRPYPTSRRMLQRPSNSNNNNNYNGGNGRGKVAALRQQNQLQPRMAANKARQARAMSSRGTTRANESSNETADEDREPSDDEIFKDDDPADRRSSGGSTDHDNDDQAEEGSDVRRRTAQTMNKAASGQLSSRGGGGDGDGSNKRVSNNNNWSSDQAAEAIRYNAAKNSPSGTANDDSSVYDDRTIDSGSDGRTEASGEDDDQDESLSATQLRHQKSFYVEQPDLQVAAGHHHGHHHGHYYQYVEVPKKKAWKFGFKRGNHKHTIERHEKGHKNKFHSSFKWHAKEKCKKKEKCESKGKMSWHYEHHDKKHHG